jgi:hypothetical protein
MRPSRRRCAVHGIGKSSTGHSSAAHALSHEFRFACDNTALVTSEAVDVRGCQTKRLRGNGGCSGDIQRVSRAIYDGQVKFDDGIQKECNVVCCGVFA